MLCGRPQWGAFGGRKMKKIFLALIFGFVSTFIYAAPFGLKMGMSLSEITEACGGIHPERLENDDRYIIKPVKNHPTFVVYLAWINDEHGLYRIRGISDEKSTDKYGREIQNLFYAFEDRVESVYGIPNITDKIIDGNSWHNEDSEWSYSLREGERELSAVWEEGLKDVKLKDDISYICLYVTPSKSYGYSFVLIIDYEFSNSYEVEKNEDSVL